MALDSANPAVPGGASPPEPSAARYTQASEEVSAKLPPDPDPSAPSWSHSPLPAEIAVQVSPDGLKAFLSILPPARPVSGDLEESHILAAWRNAGLDPHHLSSGFAAELAKRWNGSRQPIENVPAAEAEHGPRPGTDAYIEYLVDPDLRIGPIDQAGTIDFKSLNLIKAVKQGQTLARRHAAGKGAPGIDLFDKPVPAPDGLDEAALPMGPNTQASASDPDTLVASVAGFLQRKDGLLSVNECFIVDGSVDYSTGNIEYGQSAVIRGDIADGFTVNVGGALEVGGSVGESRIAVGGDVLVKKGFVGAGHGLITAKGNVVLGFASNQNVRAHGNLSIEKESFNCRLHSRKTLSVFGPMVGGLSMAGEEVVCRVAGNELGTKTEIEAGMDYILHENRLLLEEKLKELTGHLARITQKLAGFREAYRVRKRFTSQEARMMLELRDMQEKIQGRLPELEKRKGDVLEQIRKGYLKDNIRVRIEKKLNPGVVIKVGSEAIRIQEETSGPKVFVFKLGRIKVI